MNDNFTNSDKLVQYLDGELQGEALNDLREKLATDKDLAEELERLRLTKAAVKNYGLKNTVGNIHLEMMKELRETAPTPVIGIKRILRYSIRAAAIVLLVLGSTALYQYYSATPEQLFRNNYESFSLRDSRGSGNTSTLQDLYKEKKYTAVKEKFKQLPVPAPEDYFLYANAALNTNNAAAAVQAFLALQEKNKLNNTHFFEEDTDYYLALAYLKNNEPISAFPIFEKIHADKGHPYHGKVTAWFLRKLQRLAK